MYSFTISLFNTLYLTFTLLFKREVVAVGSSVDLFSNGKK